MQVTRVLLRIKVENPVDAALVNRVGVDQVDGVFPDRVPTRKVREENQSPDHIQAERVFLNQARVDRQEAGVTQNHTPGEIQGADRSPNHVQVNTVFPNLL